MESSEKIVKKQRKAIYFETKIIQDYEAGKIVKMECDFKLAHSTISTILIDKVKGLKSSVVEDMIIMQQKGLRMDLWSC